MRRRLADFFRPLTDRVDHAMFTAASWVTGADRMSEADRALWADCRTVSDVGRVMSMWLNGEITSRPGYCGPVDVDERDAPGLTEALVAVNLAGFVTVSSQAGWDGPGYDHAHWQQHAAVVGFAGTATLEWLTDEVAATPGLLITDCRPAGRFSRHRNDPVTFRDGRATCDFGTAMTPAEISDGWIGFGVCSPEAVSSLIGAHQVVVRDADLGRNDRLWPALAAAGKRHRSGPTTRHPIRRR